MDIGKEGDGMIVVEIKKGLKEKLNLFFLMWLIFLEVFFFMLMGIVDIFMLSVLLDDVVLGVGVVN